MGERRFGTEVPKLADRNWHDVAPYLEEFLRRLNNANDETQASLTALETGAAVSPDFPRTLPHIHTPRDLTGLEKGFEPRPPTAHKHNASEVVGLSTGFEPRTPVAHVHRLSDVRGAVGDTELILAAQVFGP